MMRNLLTAGILIILSLVIVQPLSAIPVSGPVVITSAGTYQLQHDITGDSVNTIIEIRSSGVLFDGMGHTINGVNGTTQFTNNIFVGNFPRVLRNVNIRNVTLTNRSHGIFFNNVTDSRATGCIVDRSGEDGIRVVGGNRIVLTKNTVKRSALRAVTVSKSFNTTISSSMIANNRYGLRISEEASNNTIYNNYFRNTRNILTASGVNTWNITRTAGRNIAGGNYIGGNYWSDYAGSDINTDGIGDTKLPFTALGNITGGGDRLPLISFAVTRISPSSGPAAGGTAITITGARFAAGRSLGVKIGGISATSVVRVDAATLTAVTPAGTAGAKTVVVTNGDGQSIIRNRGFTYV